MTPERLAIQAVNDCHIAPAGFACPGCIARAIKAAVQEESAECLKTVADEMRLAAKSEREQCILTAERVLAAEKFKQTAWSMIGERIIAALRERGARTDDAGSGPVSPAPPVGGDPPASR